MKLSFLSCTLLPLLVAALPAQPQQPRRPNIVIILADDMGIGDPRCYNAASKIPTPNIDKLAAQGMRFTDMHSPSAVCTPTRYGLLTGRYAWRGQLKKGVTHGYDKLIVEAGRLTLASLLKQLGYFTAIIGKWHLGLGDADKVDYTRPLRPGPNSVGFDYFFGIPASLDMDPYVYVENERVLAAPTAVMEASKSQRAGGQGFWRGGASAPGFKHEEVQPRMADKAVEFIGKQTKEKPFFLYVPLTGPHEPWVPTPEFRGKSQAGTYGDFVCQMDATLGRLMKALEDAGHADNTLLIFTSDNGAHWLADEIARFKHKANADWRGQKADIWEGGHRLPFIARWPGKIKPASVSNETLSLVDLMATVAAIGGAKLPNDAGEDSFNFLPVLLGKKLAQPVRDHVIYHSHRGGFGIRQGPWMLTPALGSQGFTAPAEVKPMAGGPTGQLYNLKDDPGQQQNLWLAQPERVKQLVDLLEKVKRDGRSRFR